MLREKSQETADTALLHVINQLKELIREGSEATATFGALKLIMIGTREATEALMDLIRTSEDPEMVETLAPVIMLSPFRDEYRAELETLVDPELVAAGYEDVSDLNPLILQEPVWETVAEALETQFAQEQIQLERAAQGGVLLAD